MDTASPPVAPKQPWWKSVGARVTVILVAGAVVFGFQVVSALTTAEQDADVPEL